jgi:hypothetical protein
MKLFNTKTSSKLPGGHASPVPSAPPPLLEFGVFLPLPPYSPEYVHETTEFEGKIDCSIKHNLGRIDIAVEHAIGENKINLLNDFLERVRNQVSTLRNNNVNASINSIAIILNVEFNLSKSIRETLSRLNAEIYGAIPLKLLLNGEDVDKMSTLSQNRVTELVADIELADVF